MLTFATYRNNNKTLKAVIHHEPKPITNSYWTSHLNPSATHTIPYTQVVCVKSISRDTSTCAPQQFSKVTYTTKASSQYRILTQTEW